MVSEQDRKRKGSYVSEPSSKKTKKNEEDVSFPYPYIHWLLFFRIY